VLSFFLKVYRYLLSTHRWVIFFRLSNTQSWKVIKQPKNVSRADPFIVFEKNKYIIFFEEYDIAKRKGYLCCGKLNSKNRCLENVRVILEKHHHLSFPFIFEFKGKYYLIPESHEAKKISLYRFSQFPYKVVKVRDLVRDIDCVDSVLTFKYNLFYLFTNVKENNDPLYCKNLTVFKSSDIEQGEFTKISEESFSNNPSYTRMAGSFVKKNGSTYRISQDCKELYGHRVNFMKVRNLSEDNYSETFSEKLYPPKGFIALHTFNCAKGIEVADGKQVLKEPLVLLVNLFKGARKFFLEGSVCKK